MFLHLTFAIFLLGFNILYESSKCSNLVIEMKFEIKIVLLSQSQLIVIIIETFLTDANNFCRLLQIKFASIFGTKMHISPLFNNFNNLSDGALPTPLLLNRRGIAAHAGTLLGISLKFVIIILEENNVGPQQLHWYKKALFLSLGIFPDLVIFVIIEIVDLEHELA